MKTREELDKEMSELGLIFKRYDENGNPIYGTEWEPIEDEPETNKTFTGTNKQTPKKKRKKKPKY